MKLAQVIFNNKIITNGYADLCYFMATVHDEWQMECHPDIADEIGKLGAESIRESGKRLGCRMNMDGEYQIGSNWSECH